MDGTNPIVVAITGTTGNFGSYVLDALCNSPLVDKIFCLNRSADARKRQLKALELRGLSSSSLEQRVEFIQTDFSAERFGLKEEIYETLVNEVSLIIHNAWSVDFNRNFVSFKPHIEGVKQLIEFARCRQTNASTNEKGSRSSSTTTDVSQHVQVLFISSIGTVSNWASQAPTSRESVPEVELMDWRLARTGYGQSKLLSERLLAHAARRYGLSVKIVRIGQLAGPVTHGVKGAWPEREWLPSLIRSSLTLKALPKHLGPSDNVDWVPVDLAARVVLELSGLNEKQPAAIPSSTTKAKPEPPFFHVVNARITQWSTLVPAIQDRMPDDVRAVTISEWVDLLKRSVEGVPLAQVNPADSSE